VAPVLAALVLGQLATAMSVTTWYPGLAKPGFNPPNWLFAPAWISLYALMMIAAWRVLRLPSETPGRRLAMTLFFLQLALNAAWSWMFFAARSPLLGMIDILPQLVVILATIAAFWRLDRAAGWCLVPLAAWVAFASVLNASIWWLNG
jgi:benzodiazapine receptor